MNTKPPTITPATDREVRNLCALNDLKAVKRKDRWFVYDPRRKNKLIGRSLDVRSLESWMRHVESYLREYKADRS